ncbi:F-box protein SKIP2 [Euphorbia peplus]|nr:F-box protein SKIP2 [Euphorbia peplus]
MGQASSSCSCNQKLTDIHSITSIFEDLTLTLPDECLATVFLKLSCNDRNSCSLVCKRWKSIDSKSRDRLVLFSPCHISSSFPSLLSRFAYVSILSLKCSRKHLSIGDDSFSRIPVLLVSLRKLKLKGCVDISDDGLVAFASHKSPLLLSKVSFASCQFGAKGIISLLANSPSLHHLTLKRLRNLDAHNTPLSVNARVNNLQRLCLKDLHNARIFIPLLAASSNTLKTLIVCRSSGNWDKVLQGLNIKKTSISEIQMENVQMGDAGLIAISSYCPELQVLQLTRTTDCTDDGLSAVSNSCKNLRKLHIDAWSRFGGRTIGDAGILSVAKQCSNMQELVLMGIPITMSSLTLLASNCTSLERLALCNTESVGDSEMGLIAEKFTALKKLCIKNCPISEKGIEAIAEGCPNLVKLKVKRCRGISEASVGKMRMNRSCVVVSVDSNGVTLPQEREQNREAVNSITTSNTTTTHVVCRSNTAVFLRSTFQNAFQVGKFHLRRPC